MSNYLLIENKGEIDINSLILMGGSTKTGDISKIGQWGSGNKYAIACLVRRGIPFKIFSGSNEIKITTNKIEFREHSFDQIFIDGRETSLTTQMGFDWEPWMAIREMVSNSRDEENNNIISSTEIISPKEGYTRIYIEHTKEIQEVIDNWDSYFSFDRTDVLYENEKGGRVLVQNRKDKNIVLYRRGIRCSEQSFISLYQYDIPSFEINESRIIKSNNSSTGEVLQLLRRCTNVEVIQNILQNAAKEETYESMLSWYYGIGELEGAWREAIGNHRIISQDYGGYYKSEILTYPCYVVCNQLARIIQQSFSDVIVRGAAGNSENVDFEKVEASDRMNFLLKECNKFFEETKYQVSYPIQIVKFVDRAETLGWANNDTIYISDKLFSMGKREIIATIIEENEHLNTKFSDCTRALQQHFINLFISEKEERFAYFC